MESTTRLGRYELGPLLGEGGMGRVYEAVLHGPLGFRKPVALKVLADGSEGLVHEARLGGLLQHRNLVEVYALEEVDGTWVCAMERVSGGSLRARLPLPPAAVVEVGLQVCAGLAEAHDAIGLVHRDLKPDNLLLEGSTVKVADLGISRARGHHGDGKVRGTVAYMAPEQASGDAVDGRADVWSMGIVLGELATGRRDAPADEVEWLAPILERCLQPDPNARYSSMRALGAALSELRVSGPGLSEFLGRSTGSVLGNLTTHDTENQTFDSYSELGGYLPNEVGLFVGRAAELRELQAVLAQPGIVTLKGIGGLGKSRLALRVAGDLRDRTLWDCWFCALESARTLDELLLTVGAALGLALRGGAAETLVDTVGRAIAARGDCVVLLDNCEQLVDFAWVFERWAEVAPRARLLCTSQAVLGLDAEYVVEVPPMAVDESVTLLVARARDRGYDVSGDPSLPMLARQLDGVPLALELAAGRLGLMSATAMIARLDKRFRLLAQQGSTLSKRQATLRGALDWSWDLLDRHEQDALACCAVFDGSFHLEQADQVLVAPDGLWSLDRLQALADRSLITRTDDRLVLMDSVRQYAREKLTDPDADLRHGRAYARFADTVIDTLGEVWNPEIEARVDEELTNLLAAAERAVDRDDFDVFWPCARAAGKTLRRRGPIGVGVRLFERALTALTLEPEQRAKIKLGLAGLHQRGGDLGQAITHLTEALEGATDLGLVSRIKAMRGGVHSTRGETEASADDFDDAMSGFVELGMAHEQARVLGNRGILLLHMGRHEDAEALIRQAIGMHQDAGNRRSEGTALGNLAVIQKQQGKLVDAQRTLVRAITLASETGDRRGEALNLGNLGSVFSSMGAPANAEKSYRRAIALHREVGSRADELLYSSNLGNLLANTGRRDEAIAIFDEVIPELAAHGDLVRAEIVRGYRGMARLWGGQDLHGARDDLRGAVDELKDRHKNAAQRYLGAAIEVELMLGEGDLAAMDEAVNTAEASGMRTDFGHLLCSQVRSLARAGRADEARAALTRLDAVLAELATQDGTPLSTNAGWARELVAGLDA